MKAFFTVSDQKSQNKSKTAPKELNHSAIAQTGRREVLPLPCLLKKNLPLETDLFIRTVLITQFNPLLLPLPLFCSLSLRLQVPPSPTSPQFFATMYSSSMLI
ncbi:hypothetical protein IEQ34_015098 [Dendrobium chrysotoxum]|uniref:Uncharacterized protein n=1 Tax=Dendrobium chrysotoxum TaxID=161865 RepID=A0AAV7GLY7_DENCH|nr:hypothetical protein IEQ34_015098 [Dendrobium chrysotoxum]